MYMAIFWVMVAAVVLLFVAYAQLKKASYGKSRCRFCGKTLKRTLGGRAEICHHCGRSQVVAEG